jgi:hypothetical protein
MTQGPMPMPAWTLCVVLFLVTCGSADGLRIDRLRHEQSELSAVSTTDGISLAVDDGTDVGSEATVDDCKAMVGTLTSKEFMTFLNDKHSDSELLPKTLEHLTNAVRLNDKGLAEQIVKTIGPYVVMRQALKRSDVCDADSLKNHIARFQLSTKRTGHCSFSRSFRSISCISCRG